MSFEKKLRKIIWSPFVEHHLTSYGIVAYCVQTDRWLLVNRRYSPEYTILIRGSYRTIDLWRILEGISASEKKQILSIFEDKKEERDRFKKNYWSTMNGATEEGFEYAWARISGNKNLIKNILETNKCEETSEWLFPKGRLNQNEDYLSCAQREFFEETGVDLKKLPSSICNLYSTNVYLTDVFKGANNRVYETKYWIYIFEQEVNLSKKNTKDLTSEIGNKMWVSFDECCALLKPSKKNILIEAARIIKNQQYRLV